VAEFIDDDEILEMAAAREADANQFYLALAARVQSPQMRKVFVDLAEEELEHKTKIELEIMKRGKVVRTDKAPPEKQDFEAGNELSKIDIDYKTMLLMGMKKEETSFRLYVDLVAMVTDKNAKETLLALAEEEVKHKLRFQQEFNHAFKDG